MLKAQYDYRTRRTKTVEKGTVKLYIYDGGVNVQEYDSAGSLTKQLVRGSGMGGGIGSILYTDSNSDSSRRFFIYNALGSVSSITDSCSRVVSFDSHDAWGQTVSASAAAGERENRKFCTKERTTSIGLDNFGFRYYDYELGRFLTRDPADYPDGPNNYLYCSNDPVNKIDPLGLAEYWTSSQS